MYADRHARPGGINPGSLGIALALNGAALAALLLAAPETLVRRPDRPLFTDNIPIQPPPPPTKPEPRPRPSTSADQFVRTPDPQVPTIKDPVIDFPLPPTPLPTPDGTLDPGLGSGEAGGTVVTPPPPPAIIGVRPDPRYADALQPPYPPEEIRAERDGKVVVKVLVGVDGRVKDVQQVSATSDAFFRATERQARSRWRFRPATRGGVPVEQWYTMSVTFVLTA